MTDKDPEENFLLDMTDHEPGTRRAWITPGGLFRATFLVSIATFVSSYLGLSQTITQQEAEQYARDLLWNSGRLASWQSSSALEIAHRLRIRYEGVQLKNLIGYDLDDSVKQMVRNGHATYSVAVDSLDPEYACVSLSFNSIPITRKFFFKGRHCVSPFSYYAKTWSVLDSKHFRFFISDSTIFNTYCINELEAFLSRMAGLLKFSGSDMRLLQERKIHYYLCRNEDEVQQLTGYPARGMFNLAYDAIISTFSTHYHELAHLLINYKLRHLSLFAHPFLQEGFAVAYGGRGGIGAGVILSLGEFLYRSEGPDVTSLLSKEAFDQLDASMSYAEAGLYNRFLAETMGIPKYLQLYQRHTGPIGSSATRTISREELPEGALWIAYIQQYARKRAIIVDSNSNVTQNSFDTSTISIGEDSSWYRFRLSDHLLVPSQVAYGHYVSKKFREEFPDGVYHGEELLIRASDEEVSIYNLLSNELVASYTAAFSIPPTRVRRFEGKYCFSVRKDILGDSIRGLIAKCGSNSLR